MHSSRASTDGLLREISDISIVLWLYIKMFPNPLIAILGSITSMYDPLDSDTQISLRRSTIYAQCAYDMPIPPMLMKYAIPFTIHDFERQFQIIIENLRSLP
jgi:hypothetical protein